MISLYQGNETNFNHNGICTLDSIVKSCEITEELNGEYSVKIEVTKDENGKYSTIQEFSIIKVQGQLFRLYNRSNLQDTGISIRATFQHISTDAYTDFLEDVRAVDKTVDVALDKVILDPRFTILSTDMTNTSTAYFVKDNPRTAIFKTILSRWGGELKRDNFNIGILSRIGRDTRMSVEYAKNILGFEQTLDYSEIVTRMMPTGKEGCTIDIVNNASKWIESPLINHYFKTFSREIQFSNIDDATQLKAAGESLWGKIDVPKTNYKVNIVSLERTDEYKNNPVYKQFGGLEIGDTVLVKHKVFNVNITARVIKLTRDGRTGKVLSLELGEFRDNIFDIIDKLDYKIDSVGASLEESKEDIYTKITQTDEKINLQAVKMEEDITGLQEEINGELVDITERLSAAELKITPEEITSTVVTSTTYKTDIQGLDTRLDTAEADIAAAGSDIGNLESRISTAEQKITASAIVSTVTQSTTYINDLGQKVTAQQASAIAQTASNVKIGFNNISDVVDIDSTGLQVNHTDGSYTKMEGGGLKRYKSGVGKYYHYLSYTGSAQFNTPAGGGDSYVIQLPDDFKGKNFDVSVSFVNNNSPNQFGDGWEFVSQLWCQLTGRDFANGTFTVKLSSAYTRYYQSWSKTSGGYITFAYTAIA